MSELDYSLANLLPPDSLKGLQRAVNLLAAALQSQHKVLIVGDYDCDGATSTALLMRALTDFGVERLDYLVPNRFEYGYGLTPEIVEVAAQKQPQLLVTVDNGIASIEGVCRAKELGMQVLITDHHLPGKSLPEADAIVNPNQPGDMFPSKVLAGVGVAFYVLLALRKHLRGQDWFTKTDINLAQYLDLIALGTVADVVPLDFNNRILVEQGLRRIRSGHCVRGISALLRLANRSSLPVTSNDLAFAVGPRINAAGRMDDMSLGIECLLTNSSDQAALTAEALDGFNRQRRKVEDEMKDQSLAALHRLKLQAGKLPAALCLYDQAWHQGVIGILAARIRERAHRPVIAFANESDNTLKGSARSIPGLHIRDALDQVATLYPGLISKFGGHAMAAGLSLPKENLTEFEVAFSEQVLVLLGGDLPDASLLSDGEIAADEINLDTAELLRLAGPWGQHFPEPRFEGEFGVINQRLLGGKHLKLLLSATPEGRSFDAIYFNFGDTVLPKNIKRVFLVYRLDVNEYENMRSSQLMVEHLEER